MLFVWQQPKDNENFHRSHSTAKQQEEYKN